MLWAIIGALCVARVPHAAQAQAPGFVVADWLRDSIYSSALGETRHVSIALPDGYDFKFMQDWRYPVLVVLDEEYLSPSAATKILTARSFSTMDGWIVPPMLIVSVHPGRTRVRDMTPPPILGQPSPRPERGGAPAFATFLADELIPWLGARYRTAPYTIVQGHSLTGLFAAWVYGQRPDKIDAVLALSPTIMWSEEAYQQVVMGVRTRTKSGRFFVAAGETEGTMIPNKVRQFLADVGRQPPPVSMILPRWYPDVLHGRTDLLGFADGLRAIFEPVGKLGGLAGFMSDPATFLTEFERRRREYVNAAPAFGLPPKLPLGFTVNMALTLGASGEYPGLRSALPTLCGDLRVSYPTSWAVPLCEGHVHFNANRADRARDAFAEALATAERSKDPVGMGLARQGAARLPDKRP